MFKNLGGRNEILGKTDSSDRIFGSIFAENECSAKLRFWTETEYSAKLDFFKFSAAIYRESNRLSKFTKS